MFLSTLDAAGAADAQGTTLVAVTLAAESKDRNRPIAEIRNALPRALNAIHGTIADDMATGLSAMPGGAAADSVTTAAGSGLRRRR